MMSNTTVGQVAQDLRERDLAPLPIQHITADEDRLVAAL
jgi:hypothetical protein